MAHTLIHYCLNVQPGQFVYLEALPAAQPLLEALVEAGLRAGGHPYVHMPLPAFDHLLLRYGTDEQIGWLPPPARVIMEQAGAHLRISSAVNTRALDSTDPARQRLLQQSLGSLAKVRASRSAAHEMRWCLTLFPTEALAQEAGMSLREYEAFVYGACMVDRDDPIAAWKRLAAHQGGIIRELTGAKTVRIVAPGTDLRMSVAGRRYVNSDGQRNFPSGEVFTGPVEDSVEGHIQFSYPAIHQGRRVEGVRLVFQRGEVVEATATRNEDYLTTMIALDPGARRVGEVAIGTNTAIQRFTGNTLFDEKMAGTVHLALGQGYAETGSVNTSALHWDMVCDLRQGGTLFIDDSVIMRDGVLQLPTSNSLGD